MQDPDLDDGPQVGSSSPPPTQTPQQTLSAAQNPDRSALATEAAPTNGISQQPADSNMTPASKPIETWGDRVYHGVLNALGGSNEVSLQRDPTTGKMIATQVKSGPGQQWKRIISGALTGYAAGAGMKGPGSTAEKFGAGIQAGTQQVADQRQQQRQQANEDFEIEQKAATSQAQNAMLMHQVAQSTFELGRAQVAASAQDTERENTFADLIAQGGAGSQDLGVFQDFDSVVKAFKANPELHDHQAGGRIIGIPHINSEGKVDGVHAALVSPDWLNSKINQDLPIAQRTYKDGKLEESTFTIPAGSLTGDQYSKLLMAQSKDNLDEYTAAQKDKMEQNRQMHQNAESDAAAKKDRAEAGMLNATSGAGPGGNSIVDMIGSGQMPVGRMSYLMARNPEILQAVAQKYPGFDASKIESYASAYKNFTSGPASVALNAGGTVLQHLNELAALNTVESHIPGTSDHNAYMNKLDTLAPELAKFYGDTTIPAIAALKSTLGANLPGNRLKAIQTQGKSMGDKFDSYVQQWKNAAPSAAYEANMPGLSPNAIGALKKLNPNYDKSDLADLEGTRARLAPPAAAGAANPAQPAAAAGAQPGSGKVISLTDARGLPQFKGQTDAQITAAAKALGYTVQ